MNDSESHSGRRTRYRGDDHYLPQREEFYAAGSSDTVSSSQQLIRLDEPRPGVLRSRNEYVDVTKLPVRARQHRKPHRTVLSSTPRLSTDGNAVIRRDLLSTPNNRKGSDSRNSNQLFRPDDPIGRGILSANSNIDKARSDKSMVFIPEKPTTSMACQRSAMPPGRAMRVVATPSARNGLDSSTYTVITKQPRPIRPAMDSAVSHCSSDKRKTSALSTASLLDSSSSIMCKRCGRCRCTACARPRQLPSRWICGNHCLLSAQSVVNAVSCMCCVKACLYHGSGHVYDDCSTDDFYENGVVCDCDSSCASLASGQGICGAHSLWSCSSKSPDRCFRWTILGSAMTCLPCFWLYLPLKACAAGVEAAYVKYYDNGCRCDRESESNSRLINRRRRNRRSHTLPPELPSVAAAKKAAVSTCDLRPMETKKTTRRCSLAGNEAA